jgi:hypothetical protein
VRSGGRPPAATDQHLHGRHRPSSTCRLLI